MSTFPDEHLRHANRWKQSGRMALWRYTENTRNFPGWHINADEAGCRSLVALIDALVADGEGSRTLAITAPAAVRLRAINNRSGLAAWEMPKKLRLMLSADIDAWSFSKSLEPVVLEVGIGWIPKLRDGVIGILAGRGDHSIGDRDRGEPLWFWW